MKKFSKKLLVSVTTSLFLASSVGHAQNINYIDNQYYTPYNNQTNNREYVITYDSYSNNYFQHIFNNNYIIKYKPNRWPGHSNNVIKPGQPVENTKPNDNTQTKPDTEKPSTNPDTKPDTNVGANTSIEMEVVRLVNIERQKEGLAPLSYSEELSKVARIKSQDMADKKYFSHTSPTYGDPFAMMKSFGIQYKTAGENIAKGYSSAQSVMNGWMNSSGHRANILNSSFGKIGIGYVNVNGTTYWTQMFTN